MTRLSREQKRELKRTGRAPAGLTPIDVRVSAETGATVGGMPVPPAAGESLQNAALDYLHRLALATGHPVLATVHDERIGYVVLLQVHVDGSSHYAGEPVRVGEPRGYVGAAGPAPGTAPAPHPGEATPRWAAPEAFEQPAPAPGPRRDRSTHVLRAVPESAAAESQPPAPAHQVPPEPRRQPEPTPHGQAQPQAHAQPQVQPQPQPQAESRQRHEVRPEARAEWQQHPDVRAEAQAPPQAAAPPQWQAQAGPEPSGYPGPGPRPSVPAQPKREPRTLPLAAAKPAPAPPHVPEPAAAEATPEAPSAQPMAPQPKREPRTMPLTAAKEKREEQAQPAPGKVAPSTFVLRAVPEPTEGPLARPQARPPRTPDLPPTPPGGASDPGGTPQAPGPAPATGTVSPPTGEFGPLLDAEMSPAPASPSWHPDQAAVPPAPASLEPQPWPPAPVGEPAPEQTYDPSVPMDSVPVDSLPDAGPASLEPQPWPPTPPPQPPRATATAPAPEPAPPTPLLPEESATDAYSAPEWAVLEEDSDPKPAPVREFDAVAEAVLDTPEEDGGAASPFAEPMSRINEAVKLGRIQEAAEMAEQTVAQANAALGPLHPEVLKLRELTAYIAYLAGDALRSFHVSLDLAGVRHRLRDERAAYGNIQSAAAAWRAVRDPLQGLHLGRDLIAVWTDLAAEEGPAADDLEQLEKARTRMTRLTERARALDSAPYAHGQ
ncbi:conserved hypothetical protein [Streptomyces scabiei 87.22]|uniref:Tetratricopeptide repeat protein n=1 Tax=Streptomyces scabiei (strain 87.22) TaxID=680198 RepID=C9YXS0_STRSW|nr:hypothetical protein [Streptomyces scabiei]MDX2577454.1 hypothetical protein [Streptomyces scabiei]MDX2657061.1 hypothetical protein [Streptomyces scabiei]MDX2720076.1 hypothetical protein [Streptomyces scabiei]MDX2866634.1 hypothetical protein [Streptomyces scabiei]MDX2882886.1 hypothetical protein [Streptomyces scabiei]